VELLGGFGHVRPVRREKHDGDARESRIRELRGPEREAVHHRHSQVEQDEPRTNAAPKDPERLPTILGGDGRVAVALKQHHGGVADVAIVVDDEDHRAIVRPRPHGQKVPDDRRR
jgi:hypothetical protein